MAEVCALLRATLMLLIYWASFVTAAGDDAVGVKWMDISSDMRLFASHNYLIKQVVEGLKAHW